MAKETAAHRRARQNYYKLLSQAESHLESLKARGISTRNLKVEGLTVGDKLRQDLGDKSTASIKAYSKFLTKLINSEYERGYEGASLSGSLVKEYRKIETEWNEFHQRYWSEFSSKPLITSAGAEAVTVAEQQSMSKQRGNVFGSIDYKRQLNLEGVKGDKDLQRRIEILKHEMSDDYIRERELAFQQNIKSNLHYYGSQELIDAFDSLTVEERTRLQNQTLFVEEFFAHIPSDQELSDEETQDRIDSMLQTIEFIKAQR